jgi:cobalamin biosynthesis protein CbiD
MQAVTYRQKIMEQTMQDSQPKPSRRGFFFGAAATGAAAAAVMALPRVQVAEVAVAAPRPAPEKGGGYSASAHVERYYKTARV